MSDIVQQLRQGAITTDDYRWEAADLIESLRQKTQYWPDNAERDAVIRHQKEEIERLRAALERMLLEFDFMVESGVISDVRNDIIFVEARAALEVK